MQPAPIDRADERPYTAPKRLILKALRPIGNRRDLASIMRPVTSALAQVEERLTIKYWAYERFVLEYESLAKQPTHIQDAHRLRRAGSSVVEHLTFNQVVDGSIPSRLTKTLLV